MKNSLGIFVVLIIIMSSACNRNFNMSFNLENALDNGEFSEAEKYLNQQLRSKDLHPDSLEALTIQLETLDRIRKEFPYKRSDIKQQFSRYYPNVSDEQLNNWEEVKQLEMKIIDGEKRYFKRSVSNFFRLNAEAKALKDSISGKNYDGVEDFQLTVVPSYFENGINPVEPHDLRRIKVNYTVKLKPNQVPAGKIVQCWLPFPRTGSNRLPNVEFLSASQKDFIIAPSETMQRTLYMEKPAEKDKETVFTISYIFHAAAQWFNVKPDQALPYKTDSELYKKYTSERKPHIIFSNEVTRLAQEIVGDEINPVNQVEMLFYWMDKNIPWTGALEYSTMSCIPAYVLENMRGDCGMKTFLFLSMARSLGIPCKWQSGWYLLPQEKNLHDWAEVYYEGVGWVPVDPSFQLIKSDDKRIKNFYINGLDSYRLVVNDDYAQELYPPKKHYRSEPLDFQRGELEWKGGNLYFDTWSYNMEVEYLED